MQAKHLIIGAGPTGLGAANRLAELGENDFLVLEKNSHVGGLSASFKDSAGFTWDVGGHVVFSHYDYFDRLLDSLLGSDTLEHQRKAMIRMAETWVPYPFQNNIRHLPPRLRWQCVQGLLALQGRDPGHPDNFREWIKAGFGRGIADLFMLPYNFKVWATPPELMAYQWIGERVSVVDLERVLKNLVLELDDVSWGPNNTFRFPLYGGTGEIFRRLGKRVADRILIGQEAVSIDPITKKARLGDGSEINYTTLLNTSPLDKFVGKVLQSPPEAVARAAGDLDHNGAHIVGIGVKGSREDDTCWMYFPESNCPFYRVTNFHNYSPKNAPRVDGGPCRALMSEISFSEHKPEDKDAVADAAERGLAAAGLVDADERRGVVSRWTRTVDYAYPVPTLARDTALAAIQPYLEAMGIFSRGRFGGWKYEVGNMDHSVMQGVEWAEMMVKGVAEQTYAV